MLAAQVHNDNPTREESEWRQLLQVGMRAESSHWLGPCPARGGAEQRAGHARWIRENTAESLQGPSWGRSQVLLPNNVRLADLRTR